MRKTNAQRVTVTMVDGTVFRGSLNIGTVRRVSDFFKRTENSFIILFDASRDDATAKEVYFINKNHIMWAQPEVNDYDLDAGAETPSSVCVETENRD